MKSIKVLFAVFIAFSFSACEEADLRPEKQILGEWKLISSEASMHIKDKEPEESKSELSSKNLIMTFLNDGTYEIKVDDNNSDVNMVDLDAFYLSNKGTYVLRSGIVEFKSSEFASDLSAVKYKLTFDKSDGFEMKVDREMYLEMIRTLVEAQWSYFKTMGKNVDDVMVDLSSDLLEFKSKSRYSRVK